MDIKLTPQQHEAYALMAIGENVFITGQAGTGKSLVTKTFRTVYGGQRRIAMTSTTGISAILVNGTTLHSYLGIGLGTGSVGALTTKILKRPYLRQRWKHVDTLIIDEVSMLSPELFDKLEAIARAVRYDERPFGGIQLVLSGDFCQLPVVGEDNFCFEAKSWNDCIKRTVYLTKIIRQSDPVFQKCLSEVRMGEVSKQSRQLLRERCNVKLTNEHGIKPTRLFPTNAEVDLLNEEELNKLSTEFNQYDMEIQYFSSLKNREYIVEKFKKNCLAPEELQLCVGAQVMLLFNMDTERQLVNGSRGIVIKFIEDLPVVRFLDGQEIVIDYHDWDMEENDEKIMRISQIPLKLAWAVTVHKIQGATLDYAEVDLSSIFEYGQAYCALSRVKNIEGLSIRGLDFDRIKAHPKAIEYYKNL